MEFIEWLKGKKTYIVAFFAAVAQFALAMSWITLETYITIMGFLVPTGAMTYRAAMKNGRK